MWAEGIAGAAEQDADIYAGIVDFVRVVLQLLYIVVRPLLVIAGKAMDNRENQSPKGIAAFDPTGNESDRLPDLQCEVQRKLGRCMLRLQQYERLLKAMVAGMALEGPMEQLDEMRAKQRLRVTPKTAKYVEANDTDKALANRVATKLGLKLVHNGGRK